MMCTTRMKKKSVHQDGEISWNSMTCPLWAFKIDQASLFKFKRISSDLIDFPLSCENCIKLIRMSDKSWPNETPVNFVWTTNQIGSTSGNWLEAIWQSCMFHFIQLCFFIIGKYVHLIPKSCFHRVLYTKVAIILETMQSKIEVIQNEKRIWMNPIDLGPFSVYFNYFLPYKYS